MIKKDTHNKDPESEAMDIDNDDSEIRVESDVLQHGFLYDGEGSDYKERVISVSTEEVYRYVKVLSMNRSCILLGRCSLR